MDETTLREILKSHEEWLSGKGGKPADLRGAVLRGTDLRGARLCVANLFRGCLVYPLLTYRRRTDR